MSGEREKEIDGLLEAFIDAHKDYTEADEDGGDDVDDAWDRVQQFAVELAHALAAQKREH